MTKFHCEMSAVTPTVKIGHIILEIDISGLQHVLNFAARN